MNQENDHIRQSGPHIRQVLGAWLIGVTGNIVGLVLMIGLPIAYYYNADFLVLLALTFAFFLAATHAHYALKVRA